MEEYRTIKNYEGLYEVSNFGNVSSVEREFIGGYGAVCHTGGKVLKPVINKGRQNRAIVFLSKKGTVKPQYVSILVAKAFPEICGEWFEGCEVDHIDGNPENNTATNLRCVTKAVNNANINTVQKRKSNTSCRKCAQYTLDGNLIFVYKSISNAAEKTGICRTAISNSINKWQETAGGYVWKLC